MKLRDSIRARDPIFEAAQAWKKRHEEVSVHVAYLLDAETVRLKLAWPRKAMVVERDVSFRSYEITNLTPEELTTIELEAMYNEGGGDK